MNQQQQQTETDAAVDQRRESARELLKEIVSIPSVSENEQDCAHRLAAYFDAHDREVWIDDVGNVRAPADDSVLLTSHIDTVPGDIPVRITDGALWGRGSVDAKGPLVAMAIAAVRTGVSFIGVVGEEVDSRGARHVVNEGRNAPEAVVNGEPSGWDGITLGYRGLLAGTYVSTSESGHTSRPENNAIQDAMDWWDQTEEVIQSEVGGVEDSVFERVTCKPTGIDGGTSEDGLSVEATMDVQFRVPPSHTVDEIREIADSQLNGGTVRWCDEVPPVMMSPRTDLARAFRVAIRDQDGDPRLLRKTGTSDMNVFAGEWDCPMITYGPGDSDLDHAPNEHLPLCEFDRSIAVLESAIESFRE